MLAGSATALYVWYRDRKLPMEHPRYYPSQMVGIAGAIYGLWLLAFVLHNVLPRSWHLI